MEKKMATVSGCEEAIAKGFTYLWLARNEGMDPYSSPYMSLYNPHSSPSILCTIPSFPANRRQV